jgi:SAM-dependent methyltransferase
LKTGQTSEKRRSDTANIYIGFENQGYLPELYDAIYESRSHRDVAFFIDFSKRAEGKTLELGCGTGRVLIPTAIAGCEITGLDVSSRMLDKCREKLSAQKQEVRDRVKLIKGNMCDFETGGKYALVTLPFRPFQHLLTIEAQKACLISINRQLLDGGMVILDLTHCYPPSMYDPKYWVEQESQRDIKLSNGRMLRCTNRIADFHRDEQYNDIETIYYVSYPDGKVERIVQAFPFRYYFRYEVEHLLELCGFKVVDLFGDYDRSTFFNDSPEMIFIAKKK